MAETWSGSPPTCCDICGDVIIDSFVDGKTKAGPWALMCTTCHGTHGCGFGTGNGQCYVQRGEDYVEFYVGPATTLH